MLTWDSYLNISVQFSCLVMSSSLWPHGEQHTRLPCPSSTPGACSNSCPSSQWCHPTTSSSAVSFFSRLQSFPAPGSFAMSQFFASGGQSIGVSASVLPMNIQDWFPFRVDSLVVWSPCCPRDSQESKLSRCLASNLNSAMSFLNNKAKYLASLSLCFLFINLRS